MVALVPATELLGWSAEMAWSVARAAAAGGRRTVLIDCFVDAPTLHGVSGEGNDEGLVDAFEYGASFNRIVKQQPQADLFFIPAGTYSTAPEPLMQHPRWKRLSAGFRHEEALLLLYVGAEHLHGLAAEPDGVIVLAPQGQGLAAAESPALLEAIGHGLPLLAVVADEAAVARASGAHAMPAEPRPMTRAAEPAPPPVAVPEPALAPPAPVHAEPAKRSSVPMAMLVENNAAPSRRTPWMIALLIVLLGGLFAAWRYGGLAMVFARPAASPARADTTSRAPVPTPPAAAPAAMHHVDSLPFVVQVASLGQLQDAFDLSDTLAARHIGALIAPGRLGTREIYRVDTGPFATQRAADSALAALRQAGLVPARAGSALRLPLSYSLGSAATLAAADSQRARLRTAGVAAFVLGQADGTFTLFAGAYASPAQASFLAEQLTPTGSAGPPGPRAGYVP